MSSKRTSTSSSNCFPCSALFLLCFPLLLRSSSPVTRDSITSTTPIVDSPDGGDILVSGNGSFALGFFTPKGGDQRRRYVGIWYQNMPESRSSPAWVANRDKPLLDCHGALEIGRDGNLNLLNGSRNLYWTTGLSSTDVPLDSGAVANLTESGNFVLLPALGRDSLWESFSNPTNTFLPGMKWDEGMRLVSWRSEEDPNSGNYTFTQDLAENGQYIITKNNDTYWKSWEWASYISGIKREISDAIESFARMGANSINSNEDSGARRSRYNISSRKQRLELSSEGEIQYWAWLNAIHNWKLYDSAPKGECDVVGACGSFSLCSASGGRSQCNCLPGYVPVIPEGWKAKNFSGGCERKQGFDDDCGDHFVGVNISRITSTDGVIELDSKSECKRKCLEKCDCKAYLALESNGSTQSMRPTRRSGGYVVKCGIWTTNFNNIEGEIGDNHLLFVRLGTPSISSSNVSSPKFSPNGSGGSQPRRGLLITVLTAALALGVGLACATVSIAYLRKRKGRLNRERGNQRDVTAHRCHSESRIKDLIGSGDFLDETKDAIDVPFFDFESILAATNHFSDANKLGQGGFGPVYKGKFAGEDIAVKRLSSGSVQGLEEFRNEVVLIAKLQHRNLVRLLGYCIEGDEKILLYEYMPNKSLDAFIFDRSVRLTMNWEKRFDIILGISRGLLYLHQDSRLRIIHRDLKTSNVLLDEEMNPKISDFGLARIFDGKQTEANTNKVVGTYGYMSPEYALEGFFSVKSDVFSFGVVLLEIVSGKRNTGFYQSRQALNLLGHAWRLWTEDAALDLLDSSFRKSCNIGEALKCINVGLLCVQEDPSDRPTMSNVVIMLAGDTISLPKPKQPAFIVRRGDPSTSSSSSKPETTPSVELTITVEEGR